jgi:hypothetical protein
MSRADDIQLFQNAAYAAISSFEAGKEKDLEKVSRCLTIMSGLLVHAEAQMIQDSREHVARHEDRRKG